MATKRSSTRTRKTNRPAVEEIMVEEYQAPISSQPASGGWVRWVIALLLLGLFWYQTNSWPIVATVNYRPIWRWDFDKAMYDQVGQQVLDNLVVEELIKNELASKKITVDQGEVDNRISEIKKEIGSDESFAQALAFQGMTEQTLREQISMQLGLEKLVEPSTDSAKMSEDIYSLVQKLRDEGKVWMVPSK